MSKIGTISDAKKLRKKCRGKYIYINCPSCNIKRWVQLGNYKRKNFTGYCKKCCITIFGLLRRGKFNGIKHSQWKGGKHINSQGYIEIYKPNHPFCTKHKYILEHRLVMEKYLRKQPNHLALIEINGEKYLRPKWIVHHKGTKYPIDSYENRRDNHIENLLLCKGVKEHLDIHRKI